MFINKGIRKTRNTYDSLFWFRYETFYYPFESKVFRYEERETQFLSMLTFLSDTTTCGTPLQTTGPKIDYLPLASNLNSLFFSNSKILSPSLPGMTSFTSPVHFLSGFFIVTSVIVTSTPHTRVNTYTQCVHLTNPCTKPKGSQPN